MLSDLVLCLFAVLCLFGVVVLFGSSVFVLWCFVMLVGGLFGCLWFSVWG